MGVIKKVSKWIQFQYWSIHNDIMFWRMKRRADSYNNKTGRQYFVIPSGNKLIVVDNMWREHINKQLKKDGKPIITCKIMYELAYYKTSSKGISRK